jgi:photosystem I P700 chlorophyll a apoprotein A1
VLFARSSRLIPDKANLGFRFPCDGPGRGGTCQVSAWDHVFLGLFWMVRPVLLQQCTFTLGKRGGIC